MSSHPLHRVEARNRAIAKARQILAGDPRVLDVETTGLGGDAEVVEIAILNAGGNVLLKTLVRPTINIPTEAIHIHGITNRMVELAPTIADLLPAVARIATHVVTYNAAFDIRVLRQSAHAVGHELDDLLPISADCAMHLYAAFWGEWSSYRQSYRWQSLEAAIHQQEIPWPDGLPPHRAHTDAELCRRLLVAIAAAKETSP